MTTPSLRNRIEGRRKESFISLAKGGGKFSIEGNGGPQEMSESSIGGNDHIIIHPTSKEGVLTIPLRKTSHPCALIFRLGWGDIRGRLIGP